MSGDPIMPANIAGVGVGERRVAGDGVVRARLDAIIHVWMAANQFVGPARVQKFGSLDWTRTRDWLAANTSQLRLWLA